MRTGALILTGEAAPVDPIEAIVIEFDQRFRRIQHLRSAGAICKELYDEALITLHWEQDALEEWLVNGPSLKRQEH